MTENGPMIVLNFNGAGRALEDGSVKGGSVLGIAGL